MMECEPEFLHRKRTSSLIVILSTVLLIGSAHARGQVSTEKILELALPTLSGEVTVYYSEGYAERAAFLQGIAEAANCFLKKPEILGVELDLGLAVLDSEDWAKVTLMPYGISHIHNLGESPTAIVPASKDNVLVSRGERERAHDPRGLRGVIHGGGKQQLWLVSGEVPTEGRRGVREVGNFVHPCPQTVSCREPGSTGERSVSLAATGCFLRGVRRVGQRLVRRFELVRVRRPTRMRPNLSRAIFHP